MIKGVSPAVITLPRSHNGSKPFMHEAHLFFQISADDFVKSMNAAIEAKTHPNQLAILTLINLFLKHCRAKTNAKLDMNAAIRFVVSHLLTKYPDIVANRGRFAYGPRDFIIYDDLLKAIRDYIIEKPELLTTPMIDQFLSRLEFLISDRDQSKDPNYYSFWVTYLN